MTKTLFQPGKLVTLRGRDWVVLPSDAPDTLVVKPLGGSDDEITGVYLPLAIGHDIPEDARFIPPGAPDIGDFASAKYLHESARLAFRNGAGPFRCLAKLSFRPRSYQLVPLIMSLRQNVVRLMIADDVGVGKTVEALLLTRELMERRVVHRFAVICLPHLCDQWQEEIRSKLDIEAVIIRSNTQAGLDRQIQGDTSVYDFYPYQIISVDYIKSDARCDVFVQQCPELVIVDEAHACARPAGASAGQQQRYHLLSKIAAKPNQSLVMLTATPHSGKPEEFQSLLGLLRPEFEKVSLPSSTQSQRREIARHFVQRKRSDVKKWLNEDIFPQREAFEWNYNLSKSYAAFFNDILDFVRGLVTPDPAMPGKRRRVRYWAALALLRGVMSSPAVGVNMLAARLSNLDAVPDGSPVFDEADDANPVADREDFFAADTAPTQLVEAIEWSERQRRRLGDFARRLESLAGPGHDAKLENLALVAEDWIGAGFNPVVFCRYIATANYLGEQLKPLLVKKFPKLDIQVITSEDPDDVRKARVDDMEKAPQRLLIATDCLSEGINLQTLFTGVIHYDLPWNPNRLEQREGRVDRFGQTATIVKACLLYGVDNPIDGIVLDVLLRKVREIKKATGINVPFPEDSQSIIDTITQALLLNPDRKISIRDDIPEQMRFDFGDSPELSRAKDSVSRKLDEAAERDKASHSVFAQNTIQANEIEQDLKAMDDAIGDPLAVEDFVVGALQNLFGVQVVKDREHPGYAIVTGNLPPQLQGVLRSDSSHSQAINVSFVSPTPKEFIYLGRNHPFVERLCHLVMANTLARQDRRAARAAVIRTLEVSIKTTLFLFRCRNVIEQVRATDRPNLQIVAEEMLLWGWSGPPDKRRTLGHDEAKRLLAVARAAGDLSPQARANFLEQELKSLDTLAEAFNVLAENQAQRLVDAHERFSALLEKNRFQIVHPVLPMDLLGIYILLPEVPT